MTADRVAAVLAEREAIQANLLELDGSFVRRLLDGATLTGQTRQRWTVAAATLTRLWETYLAYSAVVDRIAELGAIGRRTGGRELAELTALLADGCVQLPEDPVPLARRNLTAAGRRPPVPLATAVAAMRQAFTEVAEVTSAVEAVWAAVGAPLDDAEGELGRSRPAAASLGDETETAVRDAESDLSSLRDAVNADPLALWHDGRVDTSAADRLREQVGALAARIADLDRLRARARSRIDALVASVADARAARRRAAAAWHQAATRISGLAPLPPDIAEPPLQSLTALAAGGQWSRLLAELDRCEAELAAAAARTDDVRQAAEAAIGRRDELRGRLRAYKVKAARLGAAEDEALAARYDQAHELLWTAPCDLAAAASAVSAYQQAILATKGRR